MRNRRLHDALRGFALEAAALLCDEQGAGAELEFDLDEGTGRGGPTLYHYRPLTSKFIAERWERLRALPSCPAAAEALGAGAAAYLRVNGLRGAESEPALQAMLERLYEDATDFAFPEERFERVYEHVERTLFEKSQPATVLVPVHGLELTAERVELGEGLALVRGEKSAAPDEAVWGDPGAPSIDGARAQPNALLILTREVTPDDPLPVAQAGERFREVLSGLRLWKAGGLALAAVAWRRTGDGRWQPFEIESTGVARGEPWILVEGEDEELREFMAVIEASPRSGSIAWALARFEMGLGRGFEAEALSDYLLGLRALLDPGADGSRSGLGLRVAVLCAEEPERRRTQRRVQLALALEQYLMGDGPDDYLDAVGSDPPRTLVNELERHLRALLRDLLCGYLEPDLRAMADDLLLDQSEPPGPRARHPADGPTTVSARPPRSEPPSHGMVEEIEALEKGAEEMEVRQPAAPPARKPAERLSNEPAARASPEPPGRASPEPPGRGSPEPAEVASGELRGSAGHRPDLDWDDPDSYSAPV